MNSTNNIGGTGVDEYSCISQYDNSGTIFFLINFLEKSSKFQINLDTDNSSSNEVYKKTPFQNTNRNRNQNQKKIVSKSSQDLKKSKLRDFPKDQSKNIPPLKKSYISVKTDPESASVTINKSRDKLKPLYSIFKEMKKKLFFLPPHTKGTYPPSVIFLAQSFAYLTNSIGFIGYKTEGIKAF